MSDENRQNGNISQVDESQESLERLEERKEDDKIGCEGQQNEESHMEANEIERKWNTIIREEELESLRNGSALMKEECEKELERSNQIIGQLQEDLQHSEDQFQTAVASHLQTLDGLIDVFDTRLLYLERDFESKVKALKDDHSKQKQIMTTKHDEKRKMIMMEIESQEKEYKEELEKQKQTEQHILNDMNNKGMEDINNLRFVLDSKIEELEQQFETARNGFVDETSKKVISLKTLSFKSEQMKNELDGLQRTIDSLQNSIKKVKINAEQDTLENKEKFRQLKERKASAIASYQDTKRKMETFRNFQRNKLKEVTLYAHKCKTDTEKKIQLAERILKLADLIQKLETDEEKHSIWINNSDNQPTEKKESCKNDNSQKMITIAAEKLRNSEKYENDLNSYHDKLEMVWNKYNKVLLDVEDADKEEILLMKENRRLKVRTTMARKALNQYVPN